MKNLIERIRLNLDNFLKNHVAVGSSLATVKNYRKSVEKFAFFLMSLFAAADNGNNNLPEYITPQIVRAWRDAMQADNLKAGTVRQHLVNLKVYINYVIDPDTACYPITEEAAPGIYKNPVSDKFYPKNHAEKAPYQHVMDENVLRQLWINKIPGSNSGIVNTWPRNYAIVVLLLDSKIRNSELLDLKLSDVDFDRSEIHVRSGKGFKYRRVAISYISITALRLYLASGLRPDYCTDDDYLFGTDAAVGKESFAAGNTRHAEKWHKGTSQWLSALVERHIKNVTGKSGFRTHSLRHAGAALDLNAGERLERIQAELGHSSVVTTEIYTNRLKAVSDTYKAEEAIAERDKWAEFNANKLKALETRRRRRAG